MHEAFCRALARWNREFVRHASGRDVLAVAHGGSVQLFDPAINSFVVHPDQEDDGGGSAPRFVIGLDPTVVADRIVEGHPAAHHGVPSNPEDPHDGWSLLRKLSQLTVVLPRTPGSHTTRLLRHHVPVASPAPDGTDRPTAPAPATRPGTTPAEPAAATPAGAPRPGAGAAAPTTSSGAAPEPLARLVLALESDPAVQSHLNDLIRLQPYPTMRETKRLLTLWGFYMRLLVTMLLVTVAATARGACDAMTLAEIVRRWPALVPVLARTTQDRTGLARLIGALRSGDPTPPGRPPWPSSTSTLPGGRSPPPTCVNC